MSHTGWTIRVWSCHYERSEESAFAGTRTTAKQKQIPRGLYFTPTSARTALVGDPCSPARDDNSKSQGLLMQHSIKAGAFRGALSVKLSQLYFEPEGRRYSHAPGQRYHERS